MDNSRVRTLKAVGTSSRDTSSSGPNKPLRLYDKIDPALDCGAYTLEVNHSVTGQATLSQKANTGTVHIEVTGPRFQLEPTDVAGCYPAPGSDNSPDEFLAHIALVRRTLPWERRGPVTTNGISIPWLALILLRESEIKTERNGPEKWTRTITVKELRKTLTGYLDSEPDLGDTPLRVVDVSRRLLPDLIPSSEELPLLCHVRRIGTSDQQLRKFDDDGDVATILCHRLPDSSVGETHVAFLVSLEGRGDLFPPSQTGAEKVPLVVLYHWSFKPSQLGDFEYVMKTLRFAPNGGVLRLGQLPVNAQRGIVPLGDNTLDYSKPGQDGESLYYGPLCGDADRAAKLKRTTNLALSTAPQEVREPTESVGHTYLTAFELGRLLTRANSTVLTQLYELRWGKPQIVPPELTDARPRALRRYEEVSNPNPEARWLLDEGTSAVNIKGLQAGGGDVASLRGSPLAIDEKAVSSLTATVQKQLVGDADVGFGLLNLGLKTAELQVQIEQGHGTLQKAGQY